jgi:surface carbohydrate biosynthesis protein
MTSAARRTWLIIPIETKVREFHAKLLLACVAAEKGFRVVLGGQHPIDAALVSLPRGIFFDKSVVPLRAMLFEQYRSIGLRVAAWCEEGLTINDPAEYLRRRVNGEALRQADVFYAWGDYQADLMRKEYPSCSDKILPYGNSRIDLLRPEIRSVFATDVEALRKRYGHFILINTNFSLCNHKIGEAALLADRRVAGKITTAWEESFFREWIAHKREIFSAFKEMVPKLRAAFPGRTIIIRPHPSENHDTWREVARPLPGVEVVHEGGVVPWILAADALIHNGCTTGIEAFVLGRIAVAYQPVESSVHDAHLPNDLSVRARDLAELTGCVAGRIRGESVDAAELGARWELAERYMSHLRGPLATDVIVDSLSSRDLSGPRRPGEPSLPRVTALRTYVRAQRLFRRLTHRVEPPNAHALQKFPGLTLEEVAHWVGRLQQATGRFGGLKVKMIRPGIFTLE